MCKLLFIISSQKNIEEKKKFEKSVKKLYLNSKEKKISLRFVLFDQTELILKTVKKNKLSAVIYDESLSTDEVFSSVKKIKKLMNGKSPSFVIVGEKTLSHSDIAYVGTYAAVKTLFPPRRRLVVSK